MKAVEDSLRFPGSVVDDRSFGLPVGNERGPAVGTDVARVSVEDEIGDLFCHGSSAVSLMAGDSSSLTVCFLLRRILFEGDLR